MALPALATVSDLEARIGQTIEAGPKRDRASALLADASALVRHEAHRTWVDAEGDLVATIPDVVLAIVCAAAVRAWFNPADIESVQAGQVSTRYRDVWLTGAESLRIRSLNQVSGFKSIDMTPGFGFERDLSYLVPVDYGGDPFPLGY